MIDPLVSLAFSVHGSKGIYALLLGSGVSRASAIPTGWDIVVDLVRKVAHLQDASGEPDPLAWYRQTFHEEPDYSVLLERLAASPAERQQILRGYFEPTEEERAEGIKGPTDAHRAIADLVRNGAIRVIITTNFDRLLEKALEAIGITPTVLSSPDAIEGALPLQHSACTIIKLHGDYMDTRIKNATTELEVYDLRIDTLLDRIFDEYGLIVSGWSADWDPALCRAIERCKSRRFTTYWSHRGQLGDRAHHLITLRSASAIPTQDADSFFRTLAEKVLALDELNRPHPLSTAAAVAQLKRYLVDQTHRIRLDDLVMQTTETLISECMTDYFSLSTEPTSDSFRERLQRYEALMEPLVALLSHGCYWGEDHHEAIWARTLERIARIDQEPKGGFHNIWQKMQRYPALLGMYACGIAAIAGERYGTVSTILLKPRLRHHYRNNNETPLVYNIYATKVIDENIMEHLLPTLARHYTPISDHLHTILRGPLQSLIPDDRDYDAYFDHFEYLVALHNCYCSQQVDKNTYFGYPLGRFSWRMRYQENYLQRLEHITDTMAPAMLQRGAFDGTVDNFRVIREKLHERLLKQHGMM